jgi:hypothetical protein
MGNRALPRKDGMKCACRKSRSRMGQSQIALSRNREGIPTNFPTADSVTRGAEIGSVRSAESCATSGRAWEPANVYQVDRRRWIPDSMSRHTSLYAVFGPVSERKS